MVTVYFKAGEPRTFDGEGWQLHAGGFDIYDQSGKSIAWVHYDEIVMLSYEEDPDD